MYTILEKHARLIKFRSYLLQFVQFGRNSQVRSQCLDIGEIVMLILIQFT